MALFLNNDVQARCINFAEAIDAIENGVRQMAQGDGLRRPRIDNFMPTKLKDQFLCFSSMEGGMRDPGYYALRIKPDIKHWHEVDGRMRRDTWCTRPGKFGGLVFLFSVETAELLAIMNDGWIQHVRVAATAALNAKYLARRDAKTVAMIGAGGMARSHAEAYCAVRDIETIKVFSVTPANRNAYADEMSRRLGIKVVPVDDPRKALEGADILACCTNSQQPVVKGEWIEPGTHIDYVTQWELGKDALERINAVGVLVETVVPSIANYVDVGFDIRMGVMSYAAGSPEELAVVPKSSWKAHGIEGWASRYPNARHVACCDWKTGRPYQRTDTEITIGVNQSLGIREGDMGPSAGIQGIQFATVGGKIFENARAQGLGQELPQEMFLQDLKT
jgi:hypothetical protein